MLVGIHPLYKYVLRVLLCATHGNVKCLWFLREEFTVCNTCFVNLNVHTSHPGTVLQSDSVLRAGAQESAFLTTPTTGSEPSWS